MKMASIQLPVTTGTDRHTTHIENIMQIKLLSCQCAGQSSDALGKNAAMKAQLQAMSTALAAWVAALNAQIATL
jgi:hypothetical protein